MFAATGGIDDGALEVMRRHCKPWIARLIDQQKYFGWILQDGQHAVASAGLLILDWPPHPLDPTGQQRAYILNVFVAPDYRRRGLARQLVEHCMGEARRRNIRVVALHASEAGRPLYESFGFRSTSEMLYTEPADGGASH